VNRLNFSRLTWVSAVLLMLLAGAQTSQAMNFEMINHIRVEGRIATVKKNEVLVISGKTLFVIEIPVIATISDGDSIVSLKSLKPHGNTHLNYNAFDQVIEINRKNVSSSLLSG